MSVTVLEVRTLTLSHLSRLRTVMGLGSSEDLGIPACSLVPGGDYRRASYLRLAVVQASSSVPRALPLKSSLFGA